MFSCRGISMRLYTLAEPALTIWRGQIEKKKIQRGKTKKIKKIMGTILILFYFLKNFFLRIFFL
jgi:hypothetical protein